MNKLLFATALTGSLAIAGMAYAADAPAAANHPAHNPMAEAMAMLPAGDAASIRDTMKQVHEKNKPLFEKMRALRSERLTIASADKFDDKAYLAKGEAIQQLSDQMRTAEDKAFTAAFAKLPANERKAFATAYFKPVQANPPAAKPDAPAKP